MPRIRVPPDRITRALASPPPPLKDSRQLIWLGAEPLCGDGELILHSNSPAVDIAVHHDEMDWAVAILEAADPQGDALRVGEARQPFPGPPARFERLWHELNEAGLVAI